jgi:hypothetical protein
VYQILLNSFIICSAIFYCTYLLYTNKIMIKECGSNRIPNIYSYRPFLIGWDFPHLFFSTFLFVLILISGYYYGQLSFLIIVHFSIFPTFIFVLKPYYGENKLKIGRKLYHWEDIIDYGMKFGIKDNINYPDGTFHISIKGLPKEIVIHVKKDQKERVQEILDQYIRIQSK